MATKGLTLTGDKALLKKFRRMASTVQRRVVRRPLTAALSPILKSAKRKVPQDTKALKKSIGKKVRTYKTAVWGAVGVRTDPKYWTAKKTVSAGGVSGFLGKKKEVFNKPIKYLHLVEFGTRFRAPRPFLRPALDENRGRALRIQEDGIRKNILKEAAKK